MMERIRDREITRTGIWFLSGVALLGALNYGAGQLADSTYGADRAEDYVEQSGYKQPELTDVDHMAVSLQGCGNGDLVRYEFDVTAQNGDETTVIVCKGLFKNATLRQG